ncbi:MAG: choice-of-anchor J domain-containing protein [Saprospiraceae bacterium]|nr:choice-of-anchor J domain-containing protein [Saprospiraceae bacterium]
MKQTFMLLSMLCFSTFLVHGQIIFEEDFESGEMPAGWTIETKASDGGWNVGTASALSSQYFPIRPNSGSTYIAGTNDDACNCDKSDEYLITPPIDLSNQTAAVLKFDAFYTDNGYQGFDEDATIEVSLDGTNWVVVEDLHGHGSWDRHTIDLGNYIGESTVYIGFRYDENGGWLYGFAIDNVVVEVPPSLEASLVELDVLPYGEVDRGLPIKGTVYNAGIEPITTMEVSFGVNGDNPVMETFDNISIPAFSYFNFELTNPWLPSAAGVYDIEISIATINGSTDGDPADNSGRVETEIYESVSIPFKIDDILGTVPDITIKATTASGLNLPTDLDFFPILGKDEVWVVNQRNENSGGSTIIISDASTGNPSYEQKVDGNAWHFMSLPTGIAFSSDNFNFGTSPGVKDANHNGGTFTGPTLWSSDPEIYAQPSGGNGSHLDMLHGSPFSMGIAHEVDNVFWVYDNWNKDIVRYDFVDDHGPGNDDHSDAIIRRFKNLGINGDGNIPNHMVLDKETGWLYFVDNGNDRVIRLDINSPTAANPIPLINEQLAEHSSMQDYVYEVIVSDGLEQPCGIELFENRLLVGDYATGDIVVYDVENNFAEMGRIPTNETGLTGLKVGPDGNIWYTNRLRNTLSVAAAGSPVATNDLEVDNTVRISPNPATNTLFIDTQNAGEQLDLEMFDLAGKRVLSFRGVENHQGINISSLSEGVYLLKMKGNFGNSTQKVVIQR